jgi:hypothetical protein
MFGVVQQRLDCTIHMKRNWILERSAVLLLVTVKNPKGYRFYCSNHSMRNVETGHARFIENGEVSGSDKLQNVVIQEVRVQVHVPMASKEIVVPIIDEPNNIEQQINEPPLHNEAVTNEPIVEGPQEVVLRRSQRAVGKFSGQNAVNACH